MRNLSIGFDAKRLFFNHTGLGNYSRTLVGSLEQFHPSHRYQLYVQGDVKKSDFATKFHGDSFEIVQPSKPSKLWRQKGIIKDLAIHQPDIYHGLSAELPLGIKKLESVKSIVTVHDLIYELRPKDYSLLDRKLYRSKTKQACESADGIIAISEWTKKCLIDFYKIDADKITVVRQSCLEEFYDVEEVDCELDRPAVLMMGGVMERKNMTGFIEAINLLDPRLDFDINLLGEPSEKEKKKVLSRFTQAWRGKVKWNKVYSTMELIDLFHRSSFTVYPSLLEGFGIPVPESFLCNRAVICGDHSALREAGGDGPFYVDVKRPSEIAAGLLNLLGDTELRKEKVSRGKAHALSMKPELYCAQLSRIYSSLI